MLWPFIYTSDVCVRHVMAFPIHLYNKYKGVCVCVYVVEMQCVCVFMLWRYSVCVCLCCGDTGLTEEICLNLSLWVCSIKCCLSPKLYHCVDLCVCVRVCVCA